MPQSRNNNHFKVIFTSVIVNNPGYSGKICRKLAEMVPPPPGLPKTILACPTQNEASSSGSNQTTPTLPTPATGYRHKRLQFNEVDKSKNVLFKEGHQKRLKVLRKELDYLTETSWQYQPIEYYIGQ